MKSLTGLVIKYRKITVLAWVALAIGISLISQSMGTSYSDSNSLPNSESKIAQELMASSQTQASGSTTGSSVEIVFGSKDNVKLTAADIDPVLAKLNQLRYVSEAKSPFEINSRSVSADGTVAYSQITLNASGRDLPRDAIKELISQGQSFESSHLQIEFSGDSVARASQTMVSSSEGIALLAAALVLLITFGSITATVLPLLVAVLSLDILTANVALVSHAITTAQFAPTLASLMGLGVGIDYALFIVTRFRQELHAGKSVPDSISKSLLTSGRSVLFAGVTVCISILGLISVGISSLRGVAVAAALSVLISMGAAVTLLPALLGIVGHNIDKFSLPGRRSKTHEIESGRWAKWAKAIQNKPWRVAIVSMLTLLIISVPATSIRLGTADAGTNAQGTTTRSSYDLIAKGFGAGFSGPLTVVASIPTGADLSPLSSLSESMKADSDVAEVMPAMVSADQKVVTLIVYPKSSPQSAETSDFIDRLREKTIPTAIGNSSIKVYVGGSTATSKDFASALSSKLPVFMGAVILLSFMLLMFVFRSLFIPLKAAAMNLLSIGAAFGVIVAIFQWGWGSSITSIEPGPIEPMVPMMLFAILFGLSMDYEVFLVSRIQEEYLISGDNSAAVRRGMAATGGVITAAATIMFFVFSAFIFGGERIIKELAVGLSAAIVFDATVIRSAFVPALMQLWGKANWWLPNFLNMKLPKIRIEE